MKLDESTWPVYQTSASLDSAEVIKPVMTTIKIQETLEDRIHLSRFSNYHILIRTTARILSMYQKIPTPSLLNACIDPSNVDYEKAVRF